MKSIHIIIAILFICLGQISFGQCPPPSADSTISGASAADYTLGNGDTLHITTTANYSGHVTIEGGVLFVCASAAQTMDITANGNGGQGEVYNYSTINMSSGNDQAEVDFYNYGTINKTGDLVMDMDGNWYNYGTTNITAKITAKTGGTWNNYGDIIAGGDFKLETGASFYNYFGATFDAQNFDISGYIYTAGTINCGNNYDIKTTASTDIDGGCINVPGNFTNRAPITGLICGTISIGGTSTNTSTGTITGNIAIVDPSQTTYPFVDSNSGTVGGSVTGTSCGCPGPGVPEICGNGIDDNLDGRIDEDLPGGVADNLLLWLKADVGFGGGTWLDQSPNGNDATVYGDPTQVANSLNFNPGINFDGNDHVEAPLSELQFFNGTYHAVIFTVYKPSTASTAQGIYGNQGGGGSNNINVINGTVGRGSGGHMPAPEFFGAEPHLMIYSVDEEDNVSGVANSSKIYQNGTLIYSLFFDENGSASDPNFHFGKSGSHASSLFFQGDIHEVIVYYEDDGNLAISEVERQKIQSYLALKYGITLSQDYTDSQ